MLDGFSLGKMDQFGMHPEHINDDVNSTEHTNVRGRVDEFVQKVQPLAQQVHGNDIMLTMGGDFDWNNGAYSISHCYR